MSKLYDEIMADVVDVLPPRWVEEADPEVSPLGRRMVKKILKGATIFDITNVSDYYFGGTEQEWFDPVVDFGCVRAPFAHFWMEFRRPTKVKSVVRSECDLSLLPEKVGVLGVTLDMGESEVMKFTAQSVGARAKKFAAEPGAFAAGKFEVVRTSKEILDAVECLHLRSFVSGYGKMRGPMHHVYLWIREDGSIIDYVQNVETVPGHAGPNENETAGFENYWQPALMALDMLHARNVRIVDFVPPPKLARAHLRKKGVAMVSWKTITILPFVERRLYDEKAKVREGTGSRPWNIVPGHFAHYGVVGPGGWVRGKLFGRVSGRFWISEHAAGNEEAGMVIKDYKMADPGAEPQEKRVRN